MKIGKKLKLLRKDRKMTLKELSEKSGVAIATLSRMEHDIMTGTLESHIGICTALGVKVSDFYRELEHDEKSISLIKRKEKHDQFVSSKSASVEILTSRVMTKKMMPTLIRLEKDGKMQPEENKPGSEKFIYILEGSISATVDKEEHTLTKGDSLYFDSSLPHAIKNCGAGHAAAICVLTPPEF